MSMAYIGIDPGLTGAIALINENNAEPLVWDMPTVASGKGVVKQEVCAVSLARTLEAFAGFGGSRAILERTNAMPGQGVASMFSMGVSRGVVLGVMGALLIPYEEVAPSQWKKHFGLIGADKDMSRRLALQLYPQLAKQLARKKDHNRAEAVLLATYLQRAK